jgi:hypothetical protein
MERSTNHVMYNCLIVAQDGASMRDLVAVFDDPANGFKQ